MKLATFWDKIKIGEILKFAWCTVMTLGLLNSLLDGRAGINLMFISRISVVMVIQNSLIIATVAVALFWLMKLHPFFRWSLFSLFSGDGQAVNINLLPMRVRYFGLVFVILLMINIPTIAVMEELIFRQGNKGCAQALFASLLFGLAHCLFGLTTNTSSYGL